MKTILKRQNEEKSNSKDKKKTHENEKSVEVAEMKTEISLKKEAVGKGHKFLFKD